MLESDVTGLLLTSQVHSSIELLSDEEEGGARKVEVDWFLQLVEQQDTRAAAEQMVEVMQITHA